MDNNMRASVARGAIRRNARRTTDCTFRRSPLCAALLMALGAGGSDSAVAANEIVIDGNTATTRSTETDGSISIRTTTTNGNVGFNSFKHFKVDTGNTVNLHHAADTDALVNLVHESRAEILGTVNSLKNDKIGGHLIFADPHGMLVGTDGVINAGKLTLTTPAPDFMDSVVDGGAFGNMEATDALVNGTLTADDITTTDLDGDGIEDGVIEINGRINTTGGVHIHAGTVRVGSQADSTAAIEAGTETAWTNIGNAVNVDGVAYGSAATVTNGVIEIVAESEDSIADGRDGNPLEGTANPPTDDEFAVAVNGRLAVARSDSEIPTDDNGKEYAKIDISGKDVRIGSDAELDAKGSATFDDAGTVTSAGEYVGGRVEITAERSDRIDEPGLWNPDPGLYLGSNIDIDGEVDAFSVAADGRYIDVSGSITAHRLSEGARDDGSISLDAHSEQAAMWGIVPVESGIRIDGTLDGHALSLTAFAAASVGKWPYEGPVAAVPDSDALATFRGMLRTQMETLTDAPSFGVPLVADAGAAIAIGADAKLESSGSIDVASGARRTVSTDRLLSPGLFTGVAMARGELRGDTRVAVEDGARLNAPGQIGLTAVSNHELRLTTRVVNLTSIVQANPVALSYAHGKLDVDTTVDVHRGVAIGSADRAVGGLDVRAQAVNDVALEAQAYSLAGAGLASAVSIADVDATTRATLDADVFATGDVNVSAGSFTDHFENAASAGIGLSATTMGELFALTTIDYASAPTSAMAGDASTLIGHSFEELLASGILAGVWQGLTRTKLSPGVGIGVAASDVDQDVDARIGSSADADVPDADAVPKVTAGGDVTVSAMRRMTKVRVSARASVREGLISGDYAGNAMAVGVGVTHVTNDTDATIGPGSVIDAGRVGVSGVSDMPLEETFTDYNGGVKEFFEKYFNKTAGVSDLLTTSYVASTTKTHTGLHVSGNANIWTVDNKANATVAKGATVTARAERVGGSGAWTTEFPETPLPGPGGIVPRGVNLAWREEVDVRAYARAEELHVAGNFLPILNFIGAVLGNGADATGASLNLINHEVGAAARVADGAALTADDGGIGVRARADEFVLAVSPSAGDGSGPFVGNVTAGVVNLKDHARATVAASARLAARDVTVAADYRLGGWAVTGSLMSSSASATVGFSIAGLLAETDVIARIGDPAESGVAEPASDARATVSADDLTVRARSYGDAGAVGIQVKMPGVANGLKLKGDAFRNASRPMQRVSSGLSAARFIPLLADLRYGVGKPKANTKASGTATFAGSVLGATGFAELDIDTEAELRNVRVDGHSEGADGRVSVVGRRGIETLGVAGAAGISGLLPASPSGDAASTVGLQISRGHTRGVVEGVRLDAIDDLDVFASRADGAFVAGLGAAAATTGLSAELVASLSLHIDRTTTRAALNASTVANAGGDVRVLALDESRVFSGSGAGTFGIRSAPRLKGSAGLGLTIGAVESSRTVVAEVLGSNVTAEGDLRVQAKRATHTVAVGAAMGRNSVGVSGSGAFVHAEDTVRAEIVDGTLAVAGRVEVATALDAHGIDFARADAGIAERDWLAPIDADPLNYFDVGSAELGPLAHETLADASGAVDMAIGGAVSVGGGAGVGLGTGYTDVANTTTARLVRTDFDAAPQRVRVRAIAESDTIAIGVAAGGGTRSVTGAGAFNRVGNTITAAVDAVTLEQSGPVSSWSPTLVSVRAIEQGDVRGLAFSAALSGNWGGAPAVAVNRVESEREARIDGGTLDAADFTVEALAYGTVRGRAFGLAASGGWMGGAASVPINLLEDTVTATIAGGADIEARDSVVLQAAAEQRSQVLAGSAAGAVSGAAVAGTAPVNRLTTTVHAFIGHADGARTSVRAYGHGTQTLRTGELVDEPELQRFNAIRFDEETESFEGLDSARPGDLVAATDTIRGVGVAATSVQSSASVGATLAVGSGIGLGLGATLNTVAGETAAGIRNADINQSGDDAAEASTHADQSVAVRAASLVHSADIAVIGAASGGGGVGAGVALTGVNRQTSARLEDSAVTTTGAVDVNAKTRIASNLLAVSAAGGVGAGVAGQVGVVRHAATTLATVADTALSAAELGIGADADNETLIEVGSGGIGGTGGVGIAAGVLLSGMETTAALFGNNADGIDIANAVSVNASTDSSLHNHIVGVAVAGGVGVAGSIAYSEFANNTQATVAGTGDDRLTLGSAGDRLGMLDAGAEENVAVGTSAGSIGIGMAGAGLGGAAAMVVGRSTVGTTVSNVDAHAQLIDIDAERDLWLRTSAMSGASGAGAVAGGASLILLGDADMGRLGPELDAGGDGSLSLVGDLGPDAGDLSLDVESVDEDERSAMTDAVNVSPSLGDGGDRADGAIVDIDDARLDSSSVIDIDATTRVGTKARAGVGASGALGAGVGVARTVLASDTEVDIDGARLIADHSVNLSAGALDHADQRALDVKVASGAAAAFLALGGSFAHGENTQNVTVNVDDSHLDAGYAGVQARNEQTARVKAYAGAVSQYTGVGTLTRLVLDTATTVAVNGDAGAWRVGGLDIDAHNDLRWAHTASGAGIGLVAGFAGADAGARLTARSAVTLSGGLAVTLPRQLRPAGVGIDVHATNTLEHVGDDPVAAGYAGGLIAGAFPFSETTLDADADVTIGSGVELDAHGGDPDGRGGDIELGAVNDITINDRIHSGAGGAVAATRGEKAGIKVTGTVDQTVTVGADARLFAARDIDAFTRADLDLDIAAGASANGVGAGAAVAGTVDLDIVQAVTIDRTVELGAFRDILLDAGTRGDSDIALHTEAYTRGFVGVATADAKVDLDYEAVLDAGAGDGAAGFIRASQDVRLAAGAGRVEATESWDKYFSGAFVPIHRSGGSASVAENEAFTLAMPVEAGYLNDIQIRIDQGDSDVEDIDVTDSNGTDIRKALLEWTDIRLVDGEFNPKQAVDKQIDAASNTDTGAILGRLSNAMPDQVVNTVEIGDLVASAGDIVVDAGEHDSGGFSGVTFYDGASLTASGDPDIGIDNASSRFLRLLGDIRLRGGGGGTVTVAGQAIGDAGDLPGDDVTVSSGASAIDPEALRVDVSNSLDPVPAGTPAPALFVEGAIANAGGTVHLHNASGDLVQYDAVIARRLDIDVDHGTYTAYNPDGYWPSNHTAEFAAFYRDWLGLPDIDSGEVENRVKEMYPDIRDLHCFSSAGTSYCSENFERVDEADYPAGKVIGGADNPREIEPESQLRAEWIGIDAQYIDLDTDIEAGRSSELSVDLGAGVLAAIRQDRQDNPGASGYLELDAAAVEAGDDVIGARYNRDTGRIELERVTGSGPGGVYLNGHIYSSVYGAGITVHRGAADIDIDNSTGIPLELVDIDAGTPGAAVVKITDHFKTNDQDQALTTWYVDGTRFEQDVAQRETRKYETYGTYAHWADAVDALRSADPANPAPLTRIRDGSTGVYRPNSGVGFRVKDIWHADGTGSHEYDSGSWGKLPKNVPNPEVDWDSEDWLEDFELQSSEKTVGDYSVVLDGDGSFNETGVDKQYHRYYWTQIKGNIDSDRSCNLVGLCGRSYEGEIQWAKYGQLSFIRADADVGIGFTGGAGGLDIDSNAGVHVAGSVTNPSGATRIRAVADDNSAPAGWSDEAVGIFSAANAGLIDGRSVTLEATDNIGVDGEAGAVRLGGNGAIDAVSHAGSVYLAGPAQGEDALRIERVQADQGRAVIRHAGALVNAGAGTDAVVRAGAIDLDAERIGSNTDRLRIALTDADLTDGHTRIANAVNAEGATGVHLEAVSGDLLVGHIVTTASADTDGTGDISLVASGDGASIRAADDRETNFDAVVADGEAGWDALGLRNVEAAHARDVATFEAKVESGYTIYWQIRNLARDADGEVIIDAEAERFFGPYADAAGSDIRGWIATEHERLEALFDEAFPDGRPDALETFDPEATFAYDASAHEVTTTAGGEIVTVADQVQVDRQAWTDDELAAALPADATQTVAGSVLDHTPVHIAATGDVTLRADRDIGRVLDDTTFSVDGKKGWDLSDLANATEARAAILGAGTGDIACEVAGGGACEVDDATGFFLFDDGNNNKQTYEFTVQRRQVLRVDALGTLDATSGGSAMLGDGDADDGLTVGTIEAPDELRLLSTAAITADGNSGLLLHAADGLWMTSATGAIGEETDPITVAVNGAVQDAIGSGGVYLEADEVGGHGGTLTLRRVEATADGGAIGLYGGDTDHRLEGSDGTNLGADNVHFDYLGTVGGTTALSVADGTTVTGLLDGGGRLAGTGSIALGNLEVIAGGVLDGLAVAGDAGIDLTGELRVQGVLDLSGTDATVAVRDAGSLYAHRLNVATHAFTQAAGSEIAADSRAAITTTGDLIVADVRSAGTDANAIDLNSDGRIVANGMVQLAAANGGIQLTAGDDIAAEDGYLAVQAGTLSANGEGSAWIDIVEDSDIAANLDIANAVALKGTGTGTLTYGRIRSRTSTLDITGFSAVLGDGSLRSDDGTGSLLESAGALAVASNGSIGKVGVTGSMRIDSASSVDLEAAGNLFVGDLRTVTFADLVGDTIELTKAAIGTDLTVTGTTSATLGTVASGGAQTYRGATLTYGRIEAGTWSGATWAEGAITRVSNIDAEVSGDITGTEAGDHARATGEVSFLGDTVDVDTVAANDVAIEATTIDARILDATSDINLAAVTDVTVFELDAGDDLDLTAGGTWVFETLRAGGDVDARATGAIDGAEAEAGGLASFRAGYEAGGDPSAPADLELDALRAQRARLHTTGNLAVVNPELERGLEVRADEWTLNGFDTDGGRFTMDIASADGGLIDRVDLEVTGADRLVFSGLQAREGRIDTDSAVVSMDTARVTGALGLHTPYIDLLAKNDAPVLQSSGYDTQLYARDDEFSLLQWRRLTFTDARILRFGRLFGSGMPGGGSDISAERLGQQSLTALTDDAYTSVEGTAETGGGVVTLASWTAIHGPHPAGTPAVRLGRNCEFRFTGKPAPAWMVPGPDGGTECGYLFVSGLANPV